MPNTPSQQFLQNVQDLTGLGAVTTAQLNQILTTGLPYQDKGLIIWTTDVAGNPSIPPADTFTAMLPSGAIVYPFQQCLWGRIQPTTGFVILYYWNPAGPTTALKNWQSIFQGAIAGASITGGVNGQIAAATITAYNIANGVITSTQIANNTITSANIAAGTITGANIAATTITAANIGNAALTGANIQASTIGDGNIIPISVGGGGLNPVGASGKLQIPAGSGGQVLQVNTGATAWQTVTDYFIALGLGTAGQIPIVNPAATALAWLTPIVGKYSATSTALNAFTTSGSVAGVYQVVAQTPGTPSYIRLVVLALNTDANTAWTAGSEFGIEGIVSNPAGGGTYNGPSGFSSFYAAPNVGVQFAPIASATGFKIINSAGTGYQTTSSLTNFAIKIYYNL